jgi:hypothetical protein
VNCCRRETWARRFFPEPFDAERISEARKEGSPCFASAVSPAAVRITKEEVEPSAPTI